MKDKIYKFILLGIVLYIVSSFVSYSLYYRIMAFILITIGIAIGIYNIVIYLKTKEETGLFFIRSDINDKILTGGENPMVRH